VLHFLHRQAVGPHDGAVALGGHILQMIEQDAQQRRVCHPLVECLQHQTFRGRGRAHTGRLHLVQPGQTALDHIQGCSQNLSHLFHGFGQQACAGFKELHHMAKDAALGFRGIGGELTLQKQVQVLRRFVRGSPLRQVALLIRRLHADGPLDRAVDFVQVEQGIVDLLFFQHLVQGGTVQRQDVQGLQLLL